MAQQYHAIVVGSGITGGLAAKKLCKNKLKVPMLGRGRNVELVKDHVNATRAPWEHDDTLVIHASMTAIGKVKSVGDLMDLLERTLPASAT